MHEKGVNTASDGRKTILDLLLQPEGEAPLSKQSIVDETYSFFFAGTHTTSFTISMATYYLLSNPSKLKKLLAELKTVTRNTEGLLEYRDVHRLPYLVSFFLRSLLSKENTSLIDLLPFSERNHQGISSAFLTRSWGPSTDCPRWGSHLGWL